jgi:hypothetical protein
MDEDLMVAKNPKTPYDEDLRAIGQTLEAKNVSVFELKKLGDWYIIQGVPDQTGSLRSKVRRWRLRVGSGSNAESLALGLSDVEQLSQTGRTKRSKPRRMPDFYSLANTLRTVGAYLDSKEVELLGLHKRPLSITLSYQDKEGHEQVEDRTIASFYNLFLEFYGKRGQTKKR